MSHASVWYDLKTKDQKGRKLITLEELNVTRDVLDFQYSLKSNIDKSQINYDLIITEWTSRGMTLYINFTEPLAVSKGDIFDEVYINVKNKNLFVSNKTGVTLSDENSEMINNFPR